MDVLGTVQPGESPGILNTGDITFGPGSMLGIELAGIAQGTLYDLLNSSGDVNLQTGSELKLSLLNGYTPNDGDSFDIMNFAAYLELSPPTTCPRCPVTNPGPQQPVSDRNHKRGSRTHGPGHAINVAGRRRLLDGRRAPPPGIRLLFI